MITDSPFQAFGLSHGVAVATIIAIALGLFFWVRKYPEREHRALRFSLAGLLLYAVISGPLNAVLRFDGATAWEKIYHTEFPLFLCDVVGVVLAIALVWRNQRLTEVGYAWAMAGTAQGLITPVLSYDWPSFEYFSFFIQHGVAPISAILLIWGFKLYPERGAYRRIWIWTWGYTITVMALNGVLRTNYGFLNGKPEVATAFDYLGDYPWYLLSLHGIAAILYFLLLLPFSRKWRNTN